MNEKRDPAGTNRKLGETRQEIGDVESSSKRPPHVTPGDEEGEIQEELPSPDAVPVLPANAAGTDKLTPDEQAVAIDDASMYNGRPEEDKDRPPSDRVSDD